MRRCRSTDEGFTLVEVMIACGIMATALAMMASVITSGLTATGYSRERQAANGLADRVLEQIRSLPMKTLSNGMGINDLAASTTAGAGFDANISKNQDGTCSGTVGTNYCYNHEVIKTTGSTDIAAAPLVPHQTTTTIGPSAYTVDSYVTDYLNNATSNAYRVTVVVSWTSALKPGTIRTVQAQTIIYAPATTGTGCQDSTLHPFPGPCQPGGGFNATAVQTPASVVITGAVGATQLDHASISGGRVLSDTSLEQVSNIKAVTQGSAAEIQAAGGPVNSVGGSSVTSNAGSYAPGTVGTYDADTLAAPAVLSASLAADVNGNALSVSTTTGDTGNAAAAVAANSSTAKCPNVTSYPSPYTGDENDALPCSGARVTSASTTAAQATLQSVGAVTLASIVGSSNASTAITDRNTAPGTGRCLSTSGDGCIRAQLNRVGAEVDAGALPAGISSAFKALNGGYFVRITGVNDAISAEGGVGTAAPSATQSGMQVTYWASVAGVPTMLTANLANLLNPLTIAALTITSGSTSITLSATATPRTSATTQSCAGTCNHTAATATSTPAVVTMTYQVVVSGTTILNTSLVLDPGPITTSVSYVPSS